MRGAPANFTQVVDETGQTNRGEGLAIVYKLLKAKLELRREATFSDGANSVSGDLITYDMKAQRLSAGAGDTGQVKIVIEPQRKNETTE